MTTMSSGFHTPYGAGLDFDGLRYEVVEAQKARTDLMKYKLVVTAILGAVAIGVGPAAGAERVPYVVGMIPAVALYVDAVCNHNDIRMMVIGRYLRSSDSPYRGYEEVAHHMRRYFNIERVALDLSSLALGLSITILGVAGAVSNWRSGDRVLYGIELMSGILGIIATSALRLTHRRTMGRLEEIPILLADDKVQQRE